MKLVWTFSKVKLHPFSPRLTFEEVKDMIAGSFNLSVTWRSRKKSVDFPVVSSRGGSELGVSINIYIPIYIYIHIQWIGLRENLQESPIFHGKIYGFL